MEGRNYVLRIEARKLLLLLIDTCPAYMSTLMILSYIWPLIKPTGNYTNETAAASSNQPCLRDVQNLMLMDKVKLNPDRTLFLILGRQQLDKVKTCTSHLFVGESRISRTQVKNWGSWF